MTVRFYKDQLKWLEIFIINFVMTSIVTPLLLFYEFIIFSLVLINFEEIVIKFNGAGKLTNIQFGHRQNVPSVCFSPHPCNSHGRSPVFGSTMSPLAGGVSATEALSQMIAVVPNSVRWAHTTILTQFSQFTLTICSLRPNSPAVYRVRY